MNKDTRDDMFKHMKRVYHKLVKHGYARPTVWDDAAEEWHVELTDSGERLQRDVRAIFDIPATPLSDTKPDDINALWLMLVTTTPPSKGGIYVHDRPAA